MTPAALRSSAGNLPAELTSFVGRRRAVAETKTLLSEARLVTLTGMGGVGKTRLARRVAKEVIRAFPDGAWQVELAELQEPALLVHTIANALGLCDVTGRWAIETLVDYLDERRMLILLDNCEHLIDACAHTADAVLRGCPGVHILATSRQSLATNGEYTYPVTPLSVPDLFGEIAEAGILRYDAVQLFVERARAVLPDFAIDSHNYQAVARLCARLDGVPLAIELAALQLRAMSVEQIIEHLDQRYLTARGSRSAPQRQQTLRALVEWSYQLCSPPERLLWRQLSPFSGSFDLDAVSAICATTDLADQDFIELIVNLVDKSVLIRPGAPQASRYQMPEIMREYGVEQLKQSGSERSTRRLHRDWCANLAVAAHDGWFGPEQVKWYRRVRDEHANVRAALEFSLTEPNGAAQAVEIAALLIDYWMAFSFMSEGRHWLDAALRQCPETSLARVRGLRAACTLAIWQTDLPEARLMLAEAEQALNHLESAEERAWIAALHAVVALVEGEFALARDRYEDAHSQFVSLDDVAGQVWTVNGLAILGLLGGGETSAIVYDDALAAAHAHGESWGRSYLLWARAIERWRAGEPGEAADLLAESLKLKQLFDDRLGIGLCIEAFAWIAATPGRPTVAAELLGSSEHTFSRIGTSVQAQRFLWADHDRCVTQLAHELGDDALATATNRGAHLTIQEVMLRATNQAIQPQRGAITDTPSDAPSSPLTPRERTIASLVSAGLSNKQIAAKLVIAQRTAEGHVEHILTKLGFSSRAQIAAWVAENRAFGGTNAEPDRPHSD